MARSRRAGPTAALGTCVAWTLALAACATGRGGARDVTFSSRPAARTLTVIHGADQESRLLGDAAGGLNRYATLVDALRARAGASALVVASGDTFLPAPLLALDVDGVPAAVAGNNLVGFAASTIGNHEFDLGEAFLAEAIEKYNFPFIASTLDAHGGPLDLIDVEGDEARGAKLWVTQNAGRLLPRALACVGGAVGADGACTGMTVGLVGAVTHTLRHISQVTDSVRVAPSPEAIRDAVQRQVDALTADGVDVIVLLSHLQDVRRELELVDLGLTGVDVIAAGGGDDRLANAEHRLLPGERASALCAGEPAGRCYPMVRRARDGDPVLIVATEGQYRYVGQLVVHLDDRGVLTGWDAAASQPWPVDDRSIVAVGGTTVKAVDAFMTRVVTAMAPLLAAVGTTPVFLNGIREAVRNRETNLGDLSADAMLYATRRARGAGEPAVAIALRNGGGIRAPIGRVDGRTAGREGGPVTELDLRTAFAFDNPLAAVTLTHAALRDTLESSLRGVGTGRGHFPQVSEGVRITYRAGEPEMALAMDAERVVGVASAGGRLRSMSYTAPGPDGVTQEVEVVRDGNTVTPEATVTIVTLSYLAKGGDGWFPGGLAVPAQPVVRDGKAVTEQGAMREYLAALAADAGWKAGTRYADPDPGKPETFARVRALAEDAGASPAASTQPHVEGPP